MFDRRRFLAASATALAMPGLASAAEPLVLWGPPATPGLLLVAAAKDPSLKRFADNVEVRIWRTPDEMRAGVSSGGMKAVVVPTYVAANLHNRGLGIRLANILTHGLLQVVAPADTVATLADLKGKRVAVPFKNDMPDFLFRRMLAAQGLKPDELNIDYSGTPPEAVQLLLGGRVDAALLSEPATSAAILLSGLRAKPLERAVDLRKLWAAATGRPNIPQAGLAVTDALTQQIGAEGIAALQRAIETALATVLADPAGVAGEAAGLFQLPAPVLAGAVPVSNLAAETASAARPDLEALFTALATDDSRIIGGKLPGDAFYAL
ncbi:ABC transporter substrate-binding protein [Bosea sp. (in: a-proteobacteria)]|uniref:ABC transporter substrate-binding protein n=1 Tax=Bosea sp. (in: a-proteobacteria) TaxID=1871050 RepID=UPI002625B708|nr:ABC transporter substrate-binding protein [Bosea sp. (in: a-proteobacteria)]MCO5091543.1 ABC transporter substrate-binding protein [Bosea sp. (in: a-proteobacteria)]